jgi:hypothetical protein
MPEIFAIATAELETSHLFLFLFFQFQNIVQLSPRVGACPVIMQVSQKRLCSFRGGDTRWRKLVDTGTGTWGVAREREEEGSRLIPRQHFNKEICRRNKVARRGECRT